MFNIADPRRVKKCPYQAKVPKGFPITTTSLLCTS